MNTNEQYEPCFLEEATHARTASGHILAVEENRGLRFTRVKDALIFPEMFATLGITPVRKKEVKPVEFVGEVGGASFDGHYTEFLIRVKGNVGGNLGEYLLGKTFRCVEVQP